MKVATATKSNGKVKDETVQEKHQRLVREWFTASAAKRAHIGQAIGDVEFQMELDGIDYEPFQRPYAQKWTMDEPALKAQIVKVRALAQDESRRDVIRARADKELAKLTKECERRGIAVPA